MAFPSDHTIRDMGDNPIEKRSNNVVPLSKRVSKTLRQGVPHYHKPPPSSVQLVNPLLQWDLQFVARRPLTVKLNADLRKRRAIRRGSSQQRHTWSF